MKSITDLASEIQQRISGFVNFLKRECFSLLKQDYGLEKICIRNYNAIKNTGILVVLAASFCARLPEHLVIQMLAATNILPRKQLRDIPDYPYYMIVAAVAHILEHAVKRRPKPLRIRKRDYLQFNLALQGF